ncbi:MAG: hypothetical protein IIY12_02530 [Clostridia bacterium]|nr:hypothetical protein [Clostridia bacterium]
MVQNRVLIISVIIVAVVVCFCAVAYMYLMGIDTKYTLNEAQTQAVMGKTPSEFISNPRPKTEKNDWLGLVFCEKAKLDDGNLVFYMNDKQKSQWKSSKDIQKRVNKARTNGNISFSSDYTSMTIRCYRETLEETITIGMDAARAFLVFQLMNGVEPDLLNVEITLVDAGTEKTVTTWSYNPENTTVATYSRSDFSFQKD